MGNTETNSINFGSERLPMSYSFERGNGIADSVKAKNFMASWMTSIFYEGPFSCRVCCSFTFNKKSGL